MINKIKNFVFSSAVALFCVASALPVLAQDPPAVTPQAPTVPEIVSTSGLQVSLVNSLQGWILIGLGVGIACVVVLLGWKWIRRFMGR